MRRFSFAHYPDETALSYSVMETRNEAGMAISQERTPDPKLSPGIVSGSEEDHQLRVYPRPPDSR
jgi:hypothetical protein